MTSLTSRARQLYPKDLYPNRRLAAKWVLAVRWLRSRNRWILEGFTPSWRAD